MRTTGTCFLPEMKETVERSIQMQKLQLITINYNSNFYSVKIPIVLSHLHNTELND